jgi:hypothetical protein
VGGGKREGKRENEKNGGGEIEIHFCVLRIRTEFCVAVMVFNSQFASPRVYARDDPRKYS